MRVRFSSSLLAAAAGLAALASATAPALAAPCSDLPNPVYVNGGGGILVETLAKSLLQANITITYVKQGSCLAAGSILNGEKLNGTAEYWDATTKFTCELDPAGTNADIGISDVFPSTCFPALSSLPVDVRDYQGPVEAYGFAVPDGSPQKSINRDAAYFVFGFGAGSGVAPWTDEKVMFIRDDASGTQQMIGVGIGVPVDRWRGIDAGSSDGVVAGISANAMNPGTIGILASEVAIKNQTTVDLLAYQDVGQSCGYYMDSTAAAKDKQNVRDGHYAIWGPFHILTKVDSKGYPLTEAARDFVAYSTGTKDPPGRDLVKVLAEAGIVPECAMRVTRSEEMGPLMSFMPPRSCGCYFDYLATGKTECTPCASSVECPSSAPACNYGYCEVKGSAEQ